MENKDKPAYPTELSFSNFSSNPNEYMQTSNSSAIFPGLTKLERFTMAAMQGAVAHFGTVNDYQTISKQCVEIAKSTLTALADSPTEGLVTQEQLQQHAIRFAESMSGNIQSNYKSGGMWFVNGALKTSEQLYESWLAAQQEREGK